MLGGGGRWGREGTRILLDPPVLPTFFPQAETYSSSLSSPLLPRSEQPLCWLRLVRRSPLPLGSGTSNCKEVSAHSGVSESLSVGARRQSQGKQHQVLAGVTDSSSPLPSVRCPQFSALPTLLLLCLAWPYLPTDTYVRTQL